MSIEVFRVEEKWQYAASNYVRVETMINYFGLPIAGEFNETEGEDYTYALAMDGDIPVGTCRIHRNGTPVAQIERVSVVPSHQKKGVGSIMLKAVEKWLLSEGIYKVVINSRTEVLHFYEKLGYVADWTKVSGEGRFECVMTSRLLVDLGDIRSQFDESDPASVEGDAYIAPLYESIFAAAVALTQDSYERNYDRVLALLLDLDDVLAKSPYVSGASVTAADARLFSVLVRFDLIYFFAYRLNKHHTKDYPNIKRYLDDLRKDSRFQSFFDPKSIKEEYYLNQTKERNPYSLVPLGPDL